MSSLEESIKRIILNTLPSLSVETQLEIVSTLLTSGVESLDDLKYVQQEDIKGLLPVIQQRKLLEAFRLETGPITLDLQVIQDDSSDSTASTYPNSSLPSTSSSLTSSSTSSLSSSTSPHPLPKDVSRVPPQDITWLDEFEVPWDKMPPEIVSAITNGRRPSSQCRRQMIRVLVDEIRKFNTNPTRTQCRTICQSIIRQYPKSFADMTRKGTLIAGGFTSLLQQVKTRIENVNRGGLYRQRSMRCHKGTRPQRGPTDSYGCTRFQPEHPSGETADTLEEKRYQMENIFKQEGLNGGQRAEVIHLMETTYSLQRTHINEMPASSIEDLKMKWPYLFTQRGIYAHFELLTDIRVLQVLELSMEECGQAIVEYFRTKSNNRDVKAILSQGLDGDLTLRVVQLLMAHFGESPAGLMIHTDMSATAADVERNFTLPATPQLILLGNELCTNGQWMISIEGHVVCEGIQPTFVSGLAALFAVFYIFSLQYPDTASQTLEFIQRRFIGINPERGSKATHGKVISKRTGKVVQKRAQSVNPQVATLLKNLLDFEWDFI